MRLKQFLYIVPLAFLAACSSKDATTAEVPTPPTPWDPVNETIKLYAGIAEGGQQVVTRAGAEDNHGTHLAMTQGTKVAVRVSGTWTGHSPETVISTPAGTVGAIAADTDSKHNLLTLAPTITWDDYGTADPANANTGRTEGLTIYGVAIDGKTDAAPNVTDDQWTSGLPWTLNADQTSGENIPAKKDLLISNNVKDVNSDTNDQMDHGRYLFDYRSQGKLLEFRHALSKITVNLKAGTDFPVAAGASEAHFENDPEVKLTSNEANASTNPEWACLTGTVNITTGAVTSQGGNAAVTMNPTATPTTGWTKTYEALVMPGSEFTDDNAIIARINADGNIYYVSAEKIRAAINTASLKTVDQYLTLSGKNYVLNITVNKTQINVTATVLDWVEVEAAEVAPKININVNYGVPGTGVRVNTFSFYRSLSLNDGYGEGDDYKINGYYRRAAELTRSGSTWTMNPQRYWSNHNQHFQFRLVWPNTTTAKKEGDNENVDPDRPGEYVQKWRPHVEDKMYGTTNYQVIEIWNDPFQDVDPNKTDISSVEGNIYHPYPSNLAIARPEFDDENTPTVIENELNPKCQSTEHTQKYLYSDGICATEGAINLKFRFVMSQVEVQLTTTSTSSSAVRLDEAKVELVNAYTHGYVMLGDRTVKPDGDKTNDELDFWKKETVGDTDTRFFRSAIVPQELTFSTAQASGNLKFKITITNGDGTKDVYYADVEPILKSNSSEKVAPNGKWESGVHYVYHLNVSKTQIKATATLANWQTVEASQEIWF